MQNLNEVKYCLTIVAISQNAKYEITKEMFDELKTSKQCLNHCLSIEEKYELIISNYLELEKECLNVSFNSMISNNDGYDDFFETRLSLNRRVINLLTTTKLYVDQIQQHVKAALMGNSKVVLDVKDLFRLEYDSFFEYRFMEAMRNYAQHRGLAVHHTSHAGKRVEKNDVSHFEYKTKIYTLRSEVIKSSKFKKSVSKEMTDKVDLMHAARVYVESISKVHCQIRKALIDTAEKARANILETIDIYKRQNNNQSFALEAISYTVGESQGSNIDKIQDRCSLILDWDDMRIKLLKKNGSLINLSRRYVSNGFL